MGFLDLFRAKDPTDQWPVHTPVPLVFDLARISLNGVRFGQPYEALITFGRPEKPQPVKTGDFCYFSSGFVVQVSGGKIAGMSFVFQDETREGFVPCRLTLQVPGQSTLPLSPETIEQTIVRLLGPPPEHDTDADETLFFYRFNSCNIELELTLAGFLKRFNAFPPSTNNQPPTIATP